MDILHIYRILEEWGNVFREKAGNAPTNRGDEESLVGVNLSISDELVDIRFDSFYTALRRRDGIALSLGAITVAHDDSEVEVCSAGCPATMHAGKVAAEDEYLIGLELGDILRGNTI